MSEFDSSILAAITPLREAGFALHWLHPRQKRPIGDNWPDVPVPSIEDLRRTHARGNNLGVRLGEPSVVAGYFLHVIDADIRVADLTDEALAALAAILPGVDLESLPRVNSGSGGASHHLYFVTDKAFSSRKLAQSEGKFRDAEGIWHRDWEIELFGTRKQVVLPPSIHPDTGKPYVWAREFDFLALDLGLAPHIPADVIEAVATPSDEIYEFESREPLDFKPGQLERDLDLISISDLDYDDWLRLGQALHHQFGGSQEGYDLWLKHSERSDKHDASQRGLRTMRMRYRSFGRYRGKPVTMGTVRQWAQEVRVANMVDQFDEVDDETDDYDALLGDTVASDDEDDDFTSTSETLKPSADAAVLDWKQLLHLSDEGALKPTLHNLRLIVENDVWTKGVVAFNEFTQDSVQRGLPGTKGKRRAKQTKPVVQLTGQSWYLQDPINGDFWTEDKDNAIRAAIEAPETQGGYGIKVPDRDLRAAIDICSRKNCFHPVREYLNGLTWDGVARIERLFIDYVGAPDDNYTRSVGRLMMAAAVVRVFEPGHKFDFAVILEGLQGKRKSTFIAALARSDAWFTELDGNWEDAKSMVEIMQGKWIVEIPELSGFAKADVRHIKAFISRRTDKVRMAYAKRAQEYHRQSIFIGSTNDEVYLKDDTGGRRWWPIRCTVDEIDTDTLTSNIDQLWAEATAVYRSMRAAKPKGMLPLYLADADAQVIAARLQESRKVESADDALAGRIAEWLSRPINDGGFEDTDEAGQPLMRLKTCLIEIWCDCLGRDIGQYTGAWPASLGRAMRLVPGWTLSGARHRFGRHGQQRAYVRGG